MSEVFSYSIDAVVEPMNDGNGHGDSLSRGVLLTGGAIDLLDDVASAMERGLAELAKSHRDVVSAQIVSRQLSVLRSDIRLSSLAMAVAQGLPRGLDSFPALSRLESRLIGGLSSAEAERALIEGATFTRAVASAALRQSASDRAMLLCVVQDSMRDIGYAPTISPRKARDVIITGRSASGQTLVIKLDPERGRITGDFAGFGGTACSLDGREFETRLRARGMRLRRTDSRIHGDPDGGPLVRESQVAVMPSAASPARLRQGPPARLTEGARKNG